MERKQQQQQQPVKAFDLVPVIEYQSYNGGVPSCAAVAGNDLYIGYTNGHVRHFLLSTSPTANKKTKYQLKYLDELTNVTKRRVVQIIVAPTIARIIGVTENQQVFVGDMFSMVGASSYSRSTPKSVTYMTTNETSNSYDLEVAICQAKKKSISFIVVTADRFISKQEISNLTGVPIKVHWSGSILLIAYESDYSLYNMMSRTETLLFPYNPLTCCPEFIALQPEQFYLNGDSLGMIINQTGEVCKAPIAWINQPVFVAYSSPYIIGISSSVIQVYSLLDQQLKQKSGFTHALATTHFSGNVYIVTEDQIYMLLPVPAEDQVERLVDSGSLEQAMALADETLGTLTRNADKIKKLKYLRQKTAVLYFLRGNLTEAFDFFTRTETPPLEVAYLYDTLGPHATPSSHALLAMHPTATHPPISTLDSDTRYKFHQELLHYITKNSAISSEELNTYHLKLLCLVDTKRVEKFLRDKPRIKMNDVIAFLKNLGLHYFVGFYYATYGFLSEALEQWKALELDEVKDIFYPGLDCIINLLLRDNITQLIMDNIPWIVERNTGKGIKLLVETSAELKDDTILKLLEAKPAYMTRYLEHVVYGKGTESSRYHTQLAQQYITIITDVTTAKTLALRTRDKLQYHLLHSDRYAVSLILNKLQNTIFKRELAILYGKRKEHEKALKVLVHEIGDTAAAEEYCRSWPSGREELHLQLLKLYLDSKATDERLSARAVDFLNSRHSVFNYSDVYEIIPDHWPIAMILPFIYRSVISASNTCRVTRIMKGLSEIEWARAKEEHAEKTSRVITITSGTYCEFCYRPFTETTCSVNPKGNVYHPHCLKQIT